MQYKRLRLFVLLCAVLLPCLVQAQGRCSLQTITGTYAFQSVGSSTVVTGDSPMPGDPIHWAALHAPSVFTGIANIKPDGTTQGFYWAVNGRVNMGLTAVPVTGKVGDLDQDNCIVIIQYSAPVSASQIATIKEVFFILDEGRELRSVAWEVPLETMAWTTTMRRISAAPLAVNACNQAQMQGRYLVKCIGVMTFDGAYPFLGSAAIIDANIDKNGNYSGTYFGRSGSFSVMPVKGNFTLKPDCSVEGTLASDMMPGINNLGRGAAYEEAKGAYFQPLVIQMPPPFPSIPQPSGACELTRVK